MDDEGLRDTPAGDGVPPLHEPPAEEPPSGPPPIGEPPNPLPEPGEPPTEEPPAEEPPSEEHPGHQPPAQDAAVGDEPVEPVVTGEDETSAVGDTAEIAAIEESLSAPEPAEPATEVIPAVDGDAAVPLIAEEEAVPGIDLGPERGANTWVWIGLVVGVLVALAALGYAWWYQTSRDITVPNVVGKLPAQATQSLNDADLRLGQVSEETTDSAPAGTVISQNPAASGTLKPGAAVSLVLAASPTTAKVPNVAGREYADAVESLASARLAAYRVESFSATVAAGYVVSQLPSAGAQLQPGAAVALAVSKGPEPTQVEVPRLTGLSESEAEKLLASAGLDGLAYRSYAASVTAGDVATQSPAPGGAVVYGTSVQYLVSLGPGTASVTVPDLKGQSRSNAESRLKNAGLKAQVVEVPSASVAKGNVMSQMPPAGSKTAKGGTVGILVSKGNLTRAAVPTLVGKPSSEASKTASSAGFVAFVVEVKTAEYPAGQVFSQWPAAGAEWPLRFPILALAAKAP